MEKELGQTDTPSTSYYTILHINLWSASNKQQQATTSKHVTEAKTSPFPAGVSKSNKLFFDREP
jgi:hypothetical protein